MRELRIFKLKRSPNNQMRLQNLEGRNPSTLNIRWRTHIFTSNNQKSTTLTSLKEQWFILGQLSKDIITHIYSTKIKKMPRNGQNSMTQTSSYLTRRVFQKSVSGVPIRAAMRIGGLETRRSTLSARMFQYTREVTQTQSSSHSRIHLKNRFQSISKLRRRRFSKRARRSYQWTISESRNL